MDEFYHRHTIPGNDAIEEHPTQHVRVLKNTEILNELAEAFFGIAGQPHVKVIELLTNDHRFDNTALYAPYLFRGKTYTSHITNKTEPVNNSRYLNIRLISICFLYHYQKIKCEDIRQTEDGTYFELGSEVIEDIPFLKNLAEKLDCHLHVYFFINTKSTSVKFLSKSTGEIILHILFESGAPNCILDDSLYI